MLLYYSGNLAKALQEIFPEISFDDKKFTQVS